MVEQFIVELMKWEMVEESVDLFIETFSSEPWNDEYESRQQVVDLFEHHLRNNYFVGYVGMLQNQIVALSLGFKKPYINGLEYYIDEFCVSKEMQGLGIGSKFLNFIESDIKKAGMRAIILNTDREFPAKAFYEKNGFQALNELVILVK